MYTDRAVNSMAQSYQDVMKNIGSSLKQVYNAAAVALIPGSGTYGMEAIAHQFGKGKKCLVIRNGYFSYRWSDIFRVTGIPSEVTVLKAAPKMDGTRTPVFFPKPIAEVVATIASERPDVVFAPHIETSCGMLLPDSYLRAIADAVHAYGGFFVLDAIAAGSVWCDMQVTGVDILLSAPQKAWSGPACVAFVLLNARAQAYVLDDEKAPSTQSFCCNLKQWLNVMMEYENVDGKGPGFKYYTTLPTDALIKVLAAIRETERFGIARSNQAAWTLGNRIREILKERGFTSVAASGYEAPGVVVVYSSVPGMYAKFKEAGLQIAGGVPLMLGEDKIGIDTKGTTFRIGLFGLDKWKNVDETCARLEQALDYIHSRL